jgi:cold shock CspA family protein
VRAKGEIVAYYVARKFGFIKPANGAHDVVFHAEAVIEGTPYIGAQIKCEIVGKRDERKKRKAIRVKILSRGEE